MKKLTGFSNNVLTTNAALLIARLGISALMLTHGLPKLVMLLSGAPVQFPPIMGMSAELSLGLAVFAEIFCSLLVITGFVTRLAVIPLIITMLVAVFFIHSADPFAIKEPALHFLLVYVVLLLTGGGKYSIDYLVQHKKTVSNHTNSGIKGRGIPADSKKPVYS